MFERSLTSVALAVMLSLAATPMLADACCIDRNGDGLCNGGDDSLSCKGGKIVSPTFPIVCPNDPLADACESFNFVAPSIRIASVMSANRILLEATVGNVDLRGAVLKPTRQVSVSAAQDVIADQTTSIVGQPGRGVVRTKVLASAAGTIDFAGATVSAGRRIQLRSTDGDVLAAGATLDAPQKSGAVILLARRGRVDLSALHSRAGHRIDVAAALGVGASASSLDTRAGKGRVRFDLSGGSLDLSGASVMAGSSLRIAGKRIVDQGANLASSLLSTTDGDIDVDVSGTLDVANASIQAAPPGDYSADVKMHFRDPLAGTAASLVDLSGAESRPEGYPPAGPYDTVELRSDPFIVPPDTDALLFDYLWMTNELPGSAHNDTFVVYLMEGATSRIVFTADTHNVSPSPLFPATGYAYSTGVYSTRRIDVRDLAGTNTPVRLVFAVEDVGDSSGASAVLLDNLRFRDRESGTLVPLSGFETQDFTGFTLSLTSTQDPFGGIITGLGDSDHPPVGNFPGPEDNDYDGNGFLSTAVPAPEGRYMAVLATGSDAFRFIQEVGGTVQAPCGNGSLDPGEQCDDGNHVNGDCCSASCTLDASGTPCSDGNACTGPDTCNGSGTCNSGGALSCDDGNPCTADSCDAQLGCQHASSCSPTPANTSTPTQTPLNTATATLAPVSTATDTPIPSNTDTPTPVPTGVPTDTPTATPIATDTATETPTETPTALAADTDTPTPVAADTPTAPAVDTDTPTETPTETPTAVAVDTDTPTETPTAAAVDTDTPTETPTAVAVDTNTPTETPTATPVDTETPTETPTAVAVDTATPTETATDTPTAVPADTDTPTETPTAIPVDTDTPTPTATATDTPLPDTATPTETETPTPTETETPTPTP